MNVYGAAGSSAGTFDFSSFTPHLQYNTNYAAATYAGEYTSFVNGENYVGFTVTVAAGESLFVAVDGATSGAAPNENRAFLNMVEIVAVPEPGALSLFAMGIGALVVTFRKRKRS
jgi:hypothetical protein